MALAKISLHFILNTAPTVEPQSLENAAVQTPPVITADVIRPLW